MIFFSEFFGGNFFEDYFEGTESREKKFFEKFPRKVEWAWTSKIDHGCQKNCTHHMILLIQNNTFSA